MKSSWRIKSLLFLLAECILVAFLLLFMAGLV
jgi:hypothetical protein